MNTSVVSVIPVTTRTVVRSGRRRSRTRYLVASNVLPQPPAYSEQDASAAPGLSQPPPTYEETVASSPPAQLPAEVSFTGASSFVMTSKDRYVSASIDFKHAIPIVRLRALCNHDDGVLSVCVCVSVFVCVCVCVCVCVLQLGWSDPRPLHPCQPVNVACYHGVTGALICYLLFVWQDLLLK